METINEVICRTVYNFMKDRINEFITHEMDAWRCNENEVWDNWGYNNSKQFLSKVKRNVKDATYVFNEIMTCNMDKDYVNDYIYKNNDDGCGEIYMMHDIDNKERYFYIDYSGNAMKPVELKKVKKVIEVETFEKV